MENYYLTEQTFSTDDFSKSFEYLISGSTIETIEKSDNFRSFGDGLISEGFYLGHNFIENTAAIEIQNSNSCILSIPSKGKYSTRLSHKPFNTCNPETGSLFLPTDSIHYSTNEDAVDDLMIIISYDQIAPLLEKNYNILNIREDGFTLEKRSEKFQVIYNLINNNLQALKYYPHLRETQHLKSSIKEIAKLFMTELIADSLNVDLKLWSSPDSLLVKKAEDLMAANPEKFFYIHEIADTVSTSVRNLQLSFKKHRNYSPMHFLRERKLHRAWSLLINPDPDTLIKNIAYDSGFINMSSFSKYYQELFGELPSETFQKAKKATALQ